MSTTGYKTSIGASAPKVGDAFDFITNAGQDLIDAGAAAVGIEKGGDIDKAVTQGAQIGRSATGINSAEDALKKAQELLAPKGTANAAGSVPAATSGGGLMAQAKRIDVTYAAVGGVVIGGGTYYFSRSVGMSIGIGLLGGVAVGFVKGMLAPQQAAR